MLWESLVADGHVRAARIRRLQPWVIVLGLVLIWLGIWIARSGPDVRPQASFAGLLQERAMKLQQHAQRTIDTLPPLNLSPQSAKSLPPQTELEAVADAIRKALTATGDLPTDEIDFKKMKVDEFWRGEWPTQQIAYVEEDDMYLLGANVYVGSPSYPQPARWVGLLKKQANGWEIVSVGGSRLVAANRIPGVYASQIPLSLEPFLPDPHDEKT